MQREGKSFRGGRWMLMALAAVASEVRAADYWWTGDLDNEWNSSIQVLGVTINTNWATSSTGVTDRVSLPGAGDLVRFVANGGVNLGSTLGQNFSVDGVRTESTVGGPVTIGGAFTLTFGAGGVTNASAQTMTVNSPLQTSALFYDLVASNASGTLRINSNLTQAKALRARGAGTVVLGDSNSFTGGVTIQDGTLKLDAFGALPGNQRMTIASGGFDLNGRAASVADLEFGDTLQSGDKGVFNTGSASAVLTVNDNILYRPASASDGVGITFATMNITAGTHTVGLGAGAAALLADAGYEMVFAAPVTGAGGIEKSGANFDLGIAEPCTYSGSTVILGGSVVMGVTNALPTNTSVLLQAGTTLRLNPTVSENSMVAGSYNTQIGSLAGGGTVSLGSATLTVGNSINTNFFGTMTGVGGKLRKVGSGTLIVSGVGTYTGGTIVSAGKLQLGSATAIAGGTDITIAGGELDLGGFSLTVDDVTFGDGVTATSKKITNGGGGGAALTVNGRFLLDPTSSAAQQPQVEVPVVLAAGLRRIVALTNVTSAGGSPIYDLVFEQPVSGSGGVQVELGTSNGDNFVAFAANMTYTGSTTVQSGGLILAKNNALPSGTQLVINGGKVDLSPFSSEGSVVGGDYDQTISTLAGAGGTIDLGDATLTLNGSTATTYAGVIHSTSGGVIDKAGSATLTLSGINTYQGLMQIRGGTIKLGSDKGLATARNVALIQGALDIGGFTPTVGNLEIGNGISVSPKTVTNSNPASGHLKLEGGIIYNAVAAGGGAEGRIEVAVELLAGQHNLTSSAVNATPAYDVVFLGPIFGSGGITKLGAASFSVAMGGFNSYSGETMINSGTIYAAVTNAMPTVGKVTLNGGVLSLNPPTTEDGIVAGSYNQTIGQLASGANGGTIHLGAATLTFGTAVTSGFQGVIDGAGGSLVKRGTGAMTMLGSFTYSGETEVREGLLRLGGGQQANSNVVIRTGATLEMGIGGMSLLRTGLIEMGATAVLEMNDNDLIVDYSGSSPIGELIGWLNDGRLRFEDFDAFLGAATYLALSEAADLGLTEFAGFAVDDTTVVGKWTYAGDANLDGQVDALDYERIDLAIGNAGVFGTAAGDLNYDGVVDALDYEQVDLNIGNGVGSPLGTVLVPEPGILSLIAAGGWVMMRRRCG